MSSDLMGLEANVGMEFTFLIVCTATGGSEGVRVGFFLKGFEAA